MTTLTFTTVAGGPAATTPQLSGPQPNMLAVPVRKVVFYCVLILYCNILLV